MSESLEIVHAITMFLADRHRAKSFYERAFDDAHCTFDPTRVPKAAEVITHLAFYAGWPNAMSAVPVAKDVFDKRPH